MIQERRPIPQRVRDLYDPNSRGAAHELRIIAGVLGDVPIQATLSHEDMFEFHHLVRREILIVADRLDGGIKAARRGPNVSEIRDARAALYRHSVRKDGARQLELLPC